MLIWLAGLAGRLDAVVVVPLGALFLAIRVLRGVGPRSCVPPGLTGREDCDKGDGNFGRFLENSSSSENSEDIALWAVEGRCAMSGECVGRGAVPMQNRMLSPEEPLMGVYGHCHYL